jgi:hypothetical protein
MGKHRDPDSEELELIFKGFAEGKDDDAVLDDIEEYLTVPRKKRFIKQRRLHYEVAKRVLGDYLRHKVDPVTAEARTKHFARLNEITRYLLTQRFEGENEEPVEILVMENPSATAEDMIYVFDYNLEQAIYEFGVFTLDNCFWPHIMAEFPELHLEQFETLLKDNSLKVIDTLKVLALRGTFKGTCPICKDW